MKEARSGVSTRDSEAQGGELSFKEPHWRDAPCIFIFMIFLVGVVVISAIDLTDYSKTKCFRNHYGDPRVAFFDPQILAIIAMCILLTFVFAGLYYYLAVVCTGQFVSVSMAIELCISLGVSIFYLAQHCWLSGAFSVAWLVFSVMLYLGLQGFVKRATLHLEVAMHVARRNPSIIVISILGAIFCAAWAVLMGSVTLAGFGKAIAIECSSRRTLRPEGGFLAVLLYLGITNYLVTEVTKSVVRVSICYTYGWWCFMPRENDPYDQHYMCSNRGGPINEENNGIGEFASIPHASWLGLLAGLTYSFGSVCLSSMWLSLLKLVAQILAAWSQTLMLNSVNIKASEDISIIILVWVLGVCVCYLDSGVSHFTNYIMVYVAVDNSSYLEGFKQAGALVVEQGINAVVNDCLAGGSLACCSWCVGILVGLCAYIYMRFIQPYPADGLFFVCSYIMLVSTQICSIVMAGISSSVQTLFVAMSSEPDRMRRVHPHVYRLLTRDLS